MARKKKEDPAVEGEDLPKDTPRQMVLMQSAAFKAIQKRFGTSILSIASEVEYRKVPRVSCGVASLDYALGGGWPLGRVNLVYGHKSSGKTTLMMLAMAELQKICGNCYSPVGDNGSCTCGDWRDMVIAMIDVEGTFEAAWAESLGVDLKRLLVSQPDHAEQALDIMEGLIRSLSCDALFLDSVAFLTPTKEIEETTSKENPGIAARVGGKGVRKFVSALNSVMNLEGWKPTVFLTNQIRMKVGVMFGSPEILPGGLAWGFATSTEVRLQTGKYQMDEDSGRPLYVTIPFRVDKNKTSPPRMEGDYKLILSDLEHKKTGQIADEDFLISQCVRLGLLTGGGKSWKLLDATYESKQLVLTALEADPILRQKVRKIVLSILLAA